MAIASWLTIHRELGCDGCRYCDYEAYGLDACCTYPGKIKVEDETEKCLTRKERGDGE